MLEHEPPGAGERAEPTRVAAPPVRRAATAPRIQCKLEVGSVDDPAEREADRIAESVVQHIRRSASQAGDLAATASEAPSRIRRATVGPQVGREGGPVTPELAGRIRRSESGGAPLEPTTRDQMEGAFGVGFPDVRIHRNSDLAPEIGASAFTHGRHIHFAPGQYDPGSESGQRLLGHELAHVTQQSDTIHRKVGFEFETGIAVASEDWVGDGLTGLGYQEQVFKSTSGNWKVVADSSNMEFVTEPFTEDPAGRVLLGTAMTEIAAWAANIPGVVTGATTPGHGRVSAIDPTAGTTSTGDMFAPLVVAMTALTDAGIEAAPQATGGVRLENIPTLIDRMLATTITAAKPAATGLNLAAVKALSDPEIDQMAVDGTISNADRDTAKQNNARLGAYQATTGQTPQTFASSLVAMNILHAQWLAESKRDAVQAVNAHVAMLPHPQPNMDKLKGLLTLVVSYLKVGALEPQVMEYSKIVAPLMARTNFYTMYRMLSPAEKGVFTSAFVLNTAGLAGTGANAVFAAGFNHKGNVEHGPTRAAWIDSIINGTPGVFGIRWSTDLMSQGSGSTAADNSSSLGSMKTADTRVGQAQPDLAVLELRRLPKRVHRTEWRQMALDIFDVIAAVT